MDLAFIDCAAFRNHLRFLAAHRGMPTVADGGIWIRSDAPDFTTWTPAAQHSPIPERCNAVRLAPQAGVEWTRRLAAAGFEPAERLHYMSLQGRDMAPVRPAAEITVGKTHRDAQAFAEIQAAGFATGNPAVDPFWEGFFQKMARRNIADPRQSFYIARVGSAPAACLLVLQEAGTAGIYSVATRPEFRNQGLSSELLDLACREARRGGAGDVILQAMAGSYAEGFYRRRGFRSLYELSVWRPLLEDRPA